MAIDYKKLKSWPFKEIVQPYTAKDCILYSLGLGLGADPLDAQQLRFVWHEAAGRAAFRSRVVERDVVVLNNGMIEYVV